MGMLPPSPPLGFSAEAPYHQTPNSLPIALSNREMFLALEALAEGQKNFMSFGIRGV
jgi:hypothetical protein